MISGLNYSPQNLTCAAGARAAKREPAAVSRIKRSGVPVVGMCSEQPRSHRGVRERFVLIQKMWLQEESPLSLAAVTDNEVLLFRRSLR